MGKELRKPKPGLLQRIGIGRKPEEEKAASDLADSLGPVEIELVADAKSDMGELATDEGLLEDVWKDVESGRAWTRKPPEKK